MSKRGPTVRADRSFLHALGVRVRAIRKLRRMTQEQLAKHIGGVTRQCVLYLETGRRDPTICEVMRIADIFGVQISTLMSDDEVRGMVTRKMEAEIAKAKKAAAVAFRP